MTQLTQQEKKEIESASQIFSRPDNFNQFQQSFSLTALRQSVVTSGLRDVMSNLSNATTQEQKQEAVKFALSTLPKEDRASLIEEANLINYSTRMYSSTFRKNFLKAYETVIKPLSEEDRANLIKPQSANHHLRFTEMVKEVQEKVGTHADGKWGPNSEQMARNHGIDIGSVVRDRSETIERNVGNVRNTSNIQTATNTIVDYYSKEENYEEFQKLFGSTSVNLTLERQGEEFFRKAGRMVNNAKTQEEREKAVRIVMEGVSSNFSAFSKIYSDVCSKDPSIEKIAFNLEDSSQLSLFYDNLIKSEFNILGSASSYNSDQKILNSPKVLDPISARSVVTGISDFLNRCSAQNIELSEREINLLTNKFNEAVDFIEPRITDVYNRGYENIQNLNTIEKDVVSSTIHVLNSGSEHQISELINVLFTHSEYKDNFLSNYVRENIESGKGRYLVRKDQRENFNAFINGDAPLNHTTAQLIVTMIRGNFIIRNPDVRTYAELSVGYDPIKDSVESELSRLASLTQVPKKNV